MSRLLQISMALFFVSVVYLLAALEIPHIGEGAPDWHTVKRPQIPLQSISADSCPPSEPPQPPAGCDQSEINSAHPPIAVLINALVCVNEPVSGWKYDYATKQWARANVATHCLSKYIQKTVTANWIDTIHCYAFIDDYGRLKALPDYR